MGSSMAHIPIRATIEEFNELTLNFQSDSDEPEDESLLSEEDRFSAGIDANEWSDEGEYQPKEAKPVWLRFLRTFGYFVLFWVVCPASLFFLVSLGFASGQIEKGWMVLWTAVSFSFPCVIITIFALLFPSNRNRKSLLSLAIFFAVSFAFYFVIVQVTLAFAIPPSCIVSDSDGQITTGATNFEIFSSTGLDMQSRIHCNYSAPFQSAMAFFGCALPSDTKVYFGGLPDHFHKAQAMAIGKSVFLDSTVCLSTQTLVHELTHVWQFQEGLWYGKDAIPALLDWIYQQKTNRTGMYNYGGENGLRHNAALGKNLTDFNFEQQAEIVADYYKSSTTTDAFNANYTALLWAFTRPIFAKCGSN